jgi:hypothetical protein
MKSTFHFGFLVCVSFLFFACSATNSLTMGITQPAVISLDPQISHIGIINRSTASEKNQTLDKIEQVLSLEGQKLDEEGAHRTIVGLLEELERGNRFETVKIITGQKEFEKGLGIFPAALTWDIVEQLCKENGVDILFSLEMYDTDTAIDYEMGMVKIPNNLGISAEVPGHRIRLNTKIKSGWRIYDPVDRIIVDEHRSNDHILSVGEGINPMRALEAIKGRKESVLSMSSNLGSSYASGTKPQRIRIARDYFVRGSDKFKIAKRRAQTGNWEGAAELWKAELAHPKGKVAGRAYYNVAISNEINGNLKRAIEFASISYEDYRNREALRYLRMLNSRLRDQKELERQLSK